MGITSGICKVKEGKVILSKMMTGFGGQVI